MPIALETFDDTLIEEMKPLFTVHQLELTPTRELNPDYDTYKLLDTSNMLKMYVSRDANNVINGYTAFIITPMMHYKQYISAIEDLFYVVPNARGAKIGLALIDFTDHALKELGVDVVIHHAKLTNNFSKLLQHKGYVVKEHLLMKDL